MSWKYVTKGALIDKKTKRCIVCNETIKYCNCEEVYKKKIHTTESNHDLFYGYSDKIEFLLEVAESKENNNDI